MKKLSGEEKLISLGFTKINDNIFKLDDYTLSIDNRKFQYYEKFYDSDTETYTFEPAHISYELALICIQYMEELNS